MGYLVKGIPNTVFSRTVTGKDFMSMENGLQNISSSIIIAGNTTNQLFISPQTATSRIVVKGITILGDGNQGTVLVKRVVGDKVILPTYFSAQNRAGTSSALNIVLEPQENIIITNTRRTTSQSFIGVIYIEIEDFEYQHN